MSKMPNHLVKYLDEKLLEQFESIITLAKLLDYEVSYLTSKKDLKSSETIYYFDLISTGFGVCISFRNYNYELKKIKVNITYLQDNHDYSSDENTTFSQILHTLSNIIQNKQPL